MKPGMGKAKGAAFERQIAVALSLWVTNNNREDIFWRASMSGGRATVAKKRGAFLAAQAGDISAVDPLGSELVNKFIIELKHYRDLDWRGAVLGRGHLMTFWNKLVGEAKSYKKYPMLIAKQNQMPIMIGLDTYGINLLGLNPHQANVTYPNHERPLHLFPFSYFLENAQPVVSPYYVPSDRRSAPERKRARRVPVRDI